jgi:uncharacterized protein YjbI with pentapeptide repeats
MNPLLPKLPPQLEQLELSQLPRSLESAEIAAPAWAGQTRKLPSLDTVRLVNPDLTAAKLHGGGWADVVIEGGLLAGTDLTGTTFRRIHVRHVRASGLSIAETKAKDVYFEQSKLDLANFRFASWTSVVFQDCTFEDTDFASCHFTNVAFRSCSLTGCDFSGAAMKNVDLRTSTLQSLKGLAGLAGTIMTTDQAIVLGPDFAASLGIHLK